MKTLIPMVDFVKNQESLLGLGGNTFRDFEKKVFAYANFLSQPLELRMFFPCDEDGEPIKIHSGEHIDESYPIEFQKAKEKVLFEGFIIVICNGENAVYDGKMASISVTEMKNKTIEFLAPYYKPILTDSAIKQLGL